MIEVSYLAVHTPRYSKHLNHYLTAWLPSQKPKFWIRHCTLSFSQVSRVLTSTARYVRFVKRLRIQEEEQRKGEENSLKTLRDQQISGFFTSCDRK